jgi:formamidopyrimidine-DNA glycosylase
LQGVEEFLNGIEMYTKCPSYPAKFGAKIYKIARDDQGTRLTYMKITGGSLKVKTLLTNVKINTDDLKKKQNEAKMQQETQELQQKNSYTQSDNDKILAFSDLRKFAYLRLLDKQGLKKAYQKYGPEPLSKEFTEEYLSRVLSEKKIAIKKLLLDQEKIAGIGNIYADEVLFQAKIHPLQPANTIKPEKVKALYIAIKEILKRAIQFRGTSTSDFRDTEGKKGQFGDILKVYRRTGLPCPNDGTPIKKITVGGRGTHFCPKEQVLE